MPNSDTLLPQRICKIGFVLAALLLAVGSGLLLYFGKGGTSNRMLPDGYLVVACNRGDDSYYALAEADFNAYGPEMFRKTKTPYFSPDIHGIASIINNLPRGPELERIVAIATKPMTCGDLTIRRLTHEECNRLKELLVDMGRSDVKISGLEWADDEDK